MRCPFKLKGYLIFIKSENSLIVAIFLLNGYFLNYESTNFMGASTELLP